MRIRFLCLLMATMFVAQIPGFGQGVIGGRQNLARPGFVWSRTKTSEWKSRSGARHGFTRSSANYPADLAPRSYIYNAWNDFFYEHYGSNSNWRVLASNDEFSINEADIREPSGTVVLAEKGEGVTHRYLD